MDTFLEDVDFGALRIDTINYEILPSSLTTSTGEHKFSLPSWASLPGKTNGVVLHEIRNVESTRTHNLDKNDKMYYLFGRAPKFVCESGSSVVIANNNASRTHFAIVHSKYEAIYLIDLGSVHGTFVGNKRVQSYQPFQLTNGNVISTGGCTSKFVVRVFPKKPGEFPQFYGFTLSKESAASFDNDTTLHTHLNQVPEVLSPKGRHLVKPESVMNFKALSFTPVPLLKERHVKLQKALFKPLSMFNLQQKPLQLSRRKSFTGELKERSINNSMEIDKDEEKTEKVEQLDLSKPIQLNLPKRSLLRHGGILKKAKSIHFNRLARIESKSTMRKVSFSERRVEISPRSLFPAPSRLNMERNRVKMSRSESLSSIESEEEVDELADFDPCRDLPDRGINLEVINNPVLVSSPTCQEKSNMLRTYSVKNIRRIEEEESISSFAFPSLRDIRRRGQGFENASPLAREGHIKRRRSERNIFSS